MSQQAVISGTSAASSPGNSTSAAGSPASTFSRSGTARRNARAGLISRQLAPAIASESLFETSHQRAAMAWPGAGPRSLMDSC
jgi:hypothetical protein